ncbi:MAG: bifunctional glycosyltransferase family 2/GtrA family protein [Pseudomonadota bacterium]
MKVALLIPAYNPGPVLIELVDQLWAAGFTDLVVVDDGSAEAFQPVFSQLNQGGRVTLLRNAVNLGKGAALKYGFNHIYNQHRRETDHLGVITADADGQHLPADIAKIAEALAEHRDSLVLGVRTFAGQVPLRSRLGNEITKVVFRFLVGASIRDTQTGLRGVPLGLIPLFLPIKANRYEFELDMLIQCATEERAIVQVPIATVYIEDNKSSHFNPVTDSLKIYMVFLRFVGSSLVTALVDNIVFIVVWGLLGNILLGQALARAVATLVNFSLNRNFVFKDQTRKLPSFLKFVALVVFMGAISYSMINMLVAYAGMGVIAAKILAETALYLINFATQRTLIFRRHETH